MIQLFENRPLHPLKLILSDVKDRLLEIFYKAFSILNSDFKNYASYYSNRRFSIKFSLAVYSANLIQPSFNRLFPGKRVPISKPALKGDYLLSTDEPAIQPSLSGLCTGACIDHMNRVRSSKRPFIEAIQEAAEKFVNGCTKKGYINHHSLSIIEPSDDWCMDKIDDPSFKDLYYAKTISFFAKNYEPLLQNQDVDDLPEGDYFIRQKAGKDLHVICLYKRSEGIFVFDPNYGTLYFKNDHSLHAFLNSSTKRMFKDSSVKISVFGCQEESC